MPRSLRLEGERFFEFLSYKGDNLGLVRHVLCSILGLIAIVLMKYALLGVLGGLELLPIPGKHEVAFPEWLWWGVEMTGNLLIVGWIVIESLHIVLVQGIRAYRGVKNEWTQ